MRLIDLSQEIYQGMPVFPMHQKTFIFQNVTHEESKKMYGSTLGFATRNLLINEHGATHSDAVYEYKPTGETIDKMPLEHFWGSAVCLDVSRVPADRYITAADLEDALVKSGQAICQGDIVLLYTGHYDRNAGTPKWLTTYTGLNRQAALWLAYKGVVNIGVDTPSIDHPDDPDFSGHQVCGEHDMTNTENLCNLKQLLYKRFLYFGLPLKLRDGTGSPVRAVAIIDE